MLFILLFSWSSSVSSSGELSSKKSLLTKSLLLIVCEGNLNDIVFPNFEDSSLKSTLFFVFNFVKVEVCLLIPDKIDVSLIFFEFCNSFISKLSIFLLLILIVFVKDLKFSIEIAFKYFTVCKQSDLLT